MNYPYISHKYAFVKFEYMYTNNYNQTSFSKYIWGAFKPEWRDLSLYICGKGNYAKYEAPIQAIEAKATFMIIKVLGWAMTRAWQKSETFFSQTLKKSY